MSFTTGTPNYGLPQYKGTDMPSWQTDMTNAFKKIDEVMGDVGSESSSAATDVTNLKTEVNVLKTTTTQTTQNLETLTTTVNTNQTNNQNDINALDTRITVEHNVNTTQTEAINQIQGQLENIPDAETLASLTGDVATLKTEVGIETRVNPDDTTEAQWRAKGASEWNDFFNLPSGSKIAYFSMLSTPTKPGLNPPYLLLDSPLFNKLSIIVTHCSSKGFHFRYITIKEDGTMNTATSDFFLNKGTGDLPYTVTTAELIAALPIPEGSQGISISNIGPVSTDEQLGGFYAIA